MRRRDDARAGFPEMLFYVEGNQVFSLDEEHELARKQIQRHRLSLRSVQRLLLHIE